MEKEWGRADGVSWEILNGEKVTIYDLLTMSVAKHE